MHKKSRVIIVLGVSGSGKSTIAEGLSLSLNIPYYDADDFHPEANIKKMSSGQSLNDKDRQPWLEGLAHNILEWSRKNGAVLACSALKEKYRTLLTSKCKEAVTWVYLKGDYELIKSRMELRQDHFMSSQLLKSQFEALEVPNYGLQVDISLPPQVIINSVLEKL
ncbi:gluconokinase [uncultured Winogradskyella sp.]|uniref:gluconokinase n=1 Tax=uncultured Winogradskyella sp. TaxID=395353 RepID=UPI0026128148|nr:gluconokinase [uncultured Winogradskyella sp.]